MPDASTSSGQSLGSFIGSLVHAVEPGVKAAVINVGGDSVVDTARLAYGDDYRHRVFVRLQRNVLAVAGDALGSPDFDFYYPYRGPVMQTDTAGVSEHPAGVRGGRLDEQSRAPPWPMRLTSSRSHCPVCPSSRRSSSSDGAISRSANPVESNLVRAYAGPRTAVVRDVAGAVSSGSIVALAIDPHLAYVFMPGAAFSILPHRYLANPSIVEPSNADELVLMLEVQRQVVRFFKSGTTGVLPPFFQNLSLATLPTTRHLHLAHPGRPSPVVGGQPCGASGSARPASYPGRSGQRCADTLSSRSTPESP